MSGGGEGASGDAPNEDWQADEVVGDYEGAPDRNPVRPYEEENGKTVRDNSAYTFRELTCKEDYLEHDRKAGGYFGTGGGRTGNVSIHPKLSP